MSGSPDKARAFVKELMRAYETYDQAVDVVSAFQFLFTTSPDMASTVAHFERFPKIRTASGVCTPDFTVLFTDGTALVGEIARLSLNDRSVESACEQILRYDQLTQVPGPAGHLVDVTDVTVLQFVPMDVGPDAVDRIIHARLLDPDHPYKPSKPPCIVQFGRDPDRYMFQRIADPENGQIDGHGREPNIGDWIRKINVPAAGFAAIKATSKFMNDPIPPLYLSVILYTQVWPSEHGRADQFEVVPAETAKTLREHYGAGTADDVRGAMTLLVSAGLAVANRDGTWSVAKPPRSRGEHNLAQVIAQRSADQVKPIARLIRTAAPPPSPHPTLFD